MALRYLNVSKPGAELCPGRNGGTGDSCPGVSDHR
ncbi:hypothetical protein MPL3365_130282 [Mesorhizobium plurifarium]|uniref:Uncharacterized protein n=1 Tax=Mesorhizobium plurifarium TaxID=69974 RepID=A0A090GST7_MESPL|nr:hypothetical protein MPL3365_130282 [Mesorhizobium plurifarium]